LIGCSVVNISASPVACVHIVEASLIPAAQSIFFVKTVAGGLVTIIFESNKFLWIRTLGAGTSLLFSSAVTFDTKGGTSSSFGCNGRIDSLNGTPFILLIVLIDTQRVILHATKDIVVTSVVYPREVVGKTLIQR
jgi:hypothetical protein